jgi:nitrous oxide reductase accessory protein NosL
MNRLSVRVWAVSTVVLLLAGVLQLGPAAREVPKPGQRDTCPVCGMFVALYPEWVATVVYRDGQAQHFDGAKDLFKYLLELAKYAPGHQVAEIDAIVVTDYYSVAPIDAHTACYVIGSDVLGPMGHELIPLATREDADEFIGDHGGRRVLSFDEVGLPLLLNLDRGRFD